MYVLDASAHAMESARLRPCTKVFGDRACLVQGRVSRLPALTAGTESVKLDLGIDVRLIR